MRNPYIFGIRHLSPAGAWHLRQFLDEKKPKIVLVEGPEDFNDQIPYLTHPETRFPVAVLAYTDATPVQTKRVYTGNWISRQGKTGMRCSGKE